MNSIEQVEKTKNRFAYGQNGLFTVGLESGKTSMNMRTVESMKWLFLSLSCGTDGEHIKSTWSINSIKKYIGLTDIPAKSS
jgi:hypothetical protein